MTHRLVRIQNAWDSEFARNRTLHGDRILCHRGCSSCCSQLFQITEIEAGQISRAVAAMPQPERGAIQDRARQYLTARRAIFPAPEQWGEAPPQGARLPCPALHGDACLLYADRPLLCRRFGIPLFNPARPANLLACELNFKPGEPIEDPGLIPIHTALHHDWKTLQVDYNGDDGFRDPQPISVARAIVEDFSSCYAPK